MQEWSICIGMCIRLNGATHKKRSENTAHFHYGMFSLKLNQRIIYIFPTQFFFRSFFAPKHQWKRWIAKKEIVSICLGVQLGINGRRFFFLHHFKQCVLFYFTHWWFIIHPHPYCVALVFIKCAK